MRQVVCSGQCRETGQEGKMPLPTPEEFERFSRSEQSRRLMEFISSEEFQKLSLSEKLRKLMQFESSKGFSFKPGELGKIVQSERAKRMTAFIELTRSEEYRKLPQSEKSTRWAEAMKELEEIPPSEAEKTWEEHTRSEEYREGHRARNQAAEQLQAIRLLSSAQKFLQRLGPTFSADLTEIAREEGLNLPEISELSPRLRDTLKRAGWNEPAPVRDF